MRKLLKLFCIALVTLILFSLAGCGALKSPPPLIVKYEDQSITADRGTTSWRYHKKGKSWGGYESDARHPLQWNRENVPYIIFSNDTATSAYVTIDYSPMPKALVVTRWSFEVWDNYKYGDSISELPSETVELVDGKLPVEPGYLYSVFAQWQHEKYNGTVYNDAFYVISASEE